MLYLPRSSSDKDRMNLVTAGLRKLWTGFMSRGWLAWEVGCVVLKLFSLLTANVCTRMQKAMGSDAKRPIPKTGIF